MRWGVRDEATDDHQTMTICRDEVKFSTGFSRLLCKVIILVSYGHKPSYDIDYSHMCFSCGFVKKLQSDPTLYFLELRSMDTVQYQQ